MHCVRCVEKDVEIQTLGDKCRILKNHWGEINRRYTHIYTEMVRVLGEADKMCASSIAEGLRATQEQQKKDNPESQVPRSGKHNLEEHRP